MGENRVAPGIARLTIIGVGLIGGSLALALKNSGYCREIVGCGRSSDSLQRAIKLGVIDRYETDPARAIVGADAVLLAVPLGAIRSIVDAIAPHLSENCVLTDAGSAKRCVVEDVRATFGEIPRNFVPGHPIAGTERSGVEAAFAELFRGRRVILTPLTETDGAAHALVTDMWEATGAEVMDMDVEHHDQVLAATSHLPHLLAYTLVNALAGMDDRAEIFRYAAGGFRDFTRIASSDPSMWHDIFIANRDPLLAALQAFEKDLALVGEHIRTGNSAALMKIFARAKFARDNFYND